MVQIWGDKRGLGDNEDVFEYFVWLSNMAGMLWDMFSCNSIMFCQNYKLHTQNKGIQQQNIGFLIKKTNWLPLQVT